MEKPETNPKDLGQSINRMDALLAEVQDPAKLQAGLGIRLALGMAQELKRGMSLGAETGELVSGWVEAFGQETVDGAVAIAREFLLKPEELKKALGLRLGAQGLGAQGLGMGDGD